MEKHFAKEHPQEQCPTDGIISAEEKEILRKKSEKHEEQSSNFRFEQVVGCCAEDSSTEGLLGRKKQKVKNKRVRHVWIATKFKNEATIWNK